MYISERSYVFFPILSNSDSNIDIPEKHQHVDDDAWFLTDVQARSFFEVKV
jgi:hypothetical protein